MISLRGATGGLDGTPALRWLPTGPAGTGALHYLRVAGDSATAPMRMAPLAMPAAQPGRQPPPPSLRRGVRSPGSRPNRVAGSGGGRPGPRLARCGAGDRAGYASRPGDRRPARSGRIGPRPWCGPGWGSLQVNGTSWRGPPGGSLSGCGPGRCRRAARRPSWRPAFPLPPVGGPAHSDGYRPGLGRPLSLPSGQAARLPGQRPAESPQSDDACSPAPPRCWHAHNEHLYQAQGATYDLSA
jgi:hypothetical protein